MPTKRVTIADVAARAGTSVTAVSLVLNNRTGARISAATAQRIKQAAEELHYRADPTARSLRTKRSNAIGIISDEVTVTRYASAIIRGCLDVADSTDNIVLINECSFDRESLLNTITAMNARRVDALIFALMRAHHITIPPLPAGVNAVIVNGTATVEGNQDNPSWCLPSVLPDEFEAGTVAGARIMEAGHRNIALIGRSEKHNDPTMSVTVAERMRGLDTVLGAHGLSFSYEVHSHHWEPDLGYRGAMEILDRNDKLASSEKITAIIAGNDRIAFGIYQAIQQRGLAIPTDMSVISFDNEVLATYLRPGLTTMALPHLEMGTVASSLLLDPTKLRKHKNSGTSLLVHMPLMERESIAAPPN